MTPTVKILTEAVETNHQFKSGALTFQPHHARLALSILEDFAPEPRAWYESLPPHTLIFIAEKITGDIPVRPRDRKKVKDGEV